jgi:hypothetical protein
MANGCSFLLNSTTEKSFGYWDVEAPQRVYERDASGIIHEKLIPTPFRALLYMVEDTLFFHSSSQSVGNLLMAHNEELLRKNAQESDTLHFRSAHFDIDFLTIPLRYRFRQGMTIPPYLVASPFCGGVYAGWRTDAASHSIQLLPNQTLRSFSILGWGIGAFAAVAPVYVSPWNTDYRSMVEYDGLGVNYGAAAIVAYQSITVGLLLGFELLLDENSALWVYQNKPWVGLSLGFNLN